MRVPAVLLALACLTSACAAGRSSSFTPLGATAVPAERPARIPASLREIPTATLDLDPGVSLHDVVRRYWAPVLRPVPSARTADPRLTDGVGVYMGDTWLGGTEELRTFRAGSVASVRRLSTTEAYARFGRAHPGGAVVLTLR